ncbi:MAG TPA: maleylpyruvate isomerase N-terminal domain-containing protein, partial [Pseudonocardiaceae bacterium]|nr:maleylpyruvate isomerase N-terminal domain-containing protein [Pseudonocardiaceae bacterium]
MAPLRDDRYLDALIVQSALFAEALRGADLKQPVPTCPDWTLYQLTEHIGQAHRWATTIVIRRATAPPCPTELVDVLGRCGQIQLGGTGRGGGASDDDRGGPPMGLPDVLS